jgi:hypothetical protein
MLRAYSKAHTGTVPSKPRRTASWGWAFLLTLVAVALAAALGVVSLPLAQAASSSYDDDPPSRVLMKGSTVLQKGRMGSHCWSYYDDGRPVGYCADYVYNFPRRAVLLRAGSTLHIRIDKPQRPDRVQVVAYPGLDRKNPAPTAAPIGKGRRLDTTLRGVQRDGKTVAWDVFFRVSQPERHYYLDTWVVWERVPGTRISYGDLAWTFRVKTR